MCRRRFSVCPCYSQKPELFRRMPKVICCELRKGTSRVSNNDLDDVVVEQKGIGDRLVIFNDNSAHTPMNGVLNEPMAIKLHPPNCDKHVSLIDGSRIVPHLPYDDILRLNLFPVGHLDHLSDRYSIQTLAQRHTFP